MFLWNEGAGRYRGTDGRFVSRAAVRATLDVVLGKQMARARGLSEQLVAGDVGLTTWRREMGLAVKAVHLEGAAVARGGWLAMTQVDYQWTGERVRSQLAYLQAFHDDLASGAAPMDGTVASRAEMYIEAGRSTQRQMETRMAIGRGKDMEKNIGGDGAGSCDGCMQAGGQGWVPIGTLTPVGARDCRSRCKCWMNYRNTGSPAAF